MARDEWLVQNHIATYNTSFVRPSQTLFFNHHIALLLKKTEGCEQFGERGVSKESEENKVKR